MIKKLSVVFFLFLFAMQFVLAGDTEIKIKTPEFTEIHLTVLDPDADYNAYAIYKQTSDAYGDATFTYSGDAFVFDLMVVLKKSDKTISSEKYRENYVAGDPIYLEIIPNGYEIRETPKISGTVTGVDSDINVTNSTEENLTAPVEPEVNSTIQEEAPKNKSGILSFFLNSEGEKQNKTDSSFKGLYYIGALVLLFIIGYLYWVIAYGNPIKASIPLMMAIVFFGGIQLLAISIIGKYIQVIVEETKNRPIYIVDKTVNIKGD